jgi:hypothetical protein
VILNNSIDQCKNVKFIIAMCSMMNDFEFASLFREKLFGILWESYFNEADTWNFIAHCELQVGFTKLEMYKFYNFNIIG